MSQFNTKTANYPKLCESGQFSLQCPGKEFKWAIYEKGEQNNDDSY